LKKIWSQNLIFKSACRHFLKSRRDKSHLAIELSGIADNWSSLAYTDEGLLFFWPMILLRAFMLNIAGVGYEDSKESDDSDPCKYPSKWMCIPAVLAFDTSSWFGCLRTCRV
jgi:hypothetical protein